MNAVTKTEPATVSGLALLREPFAPNQISKLPKPTRKQTDDVKANFKLGIRCELCGAWHHKDVVHLDYVGHAALTDRLLDCDPEWNWEPVAVDERGQPMLDQTGGMWIKLTVCGVTRLGYGDADGKTGGNAVKERIGDALRNAAMRFGAALDLWHKGDLHAIEAQDAEDAIKPRTVTPEQFTKLRDMIESAGVNEGKVLERYGADTLQQFPAIKFDAAMKALQLTVDGNAKPNADLDGDEIPENAEGTP